MANSTTTQQSGFPRDLVGTEDLKSGIDFRSLHPLRNSSPNQTYKSVFTLNDYVWTNDSRTDATQNIMEKDRMVPKLNVTEFQPDFLFNYADQINQIVAGGVEIAKGVGIDRIFGSKKAFDEVQSGSGSDSATAKTLYSSGQKIVTGGVQAAAKMAGQAAMKSLLNDIASNKDGASTKNLITTPMEYINGMFSGYYLGKFEIPYFEDTYLHVDGESGWSSKGAQESLGVMATNFVKNSLPLNFPSTPEWNNSEMKRPDRITAEFVLRNRDVQSFKNNFKFLHALASGAFWSQIGVLQKSPNLYNVECLGRFNYYYCTMDITVNFYGKTRQMFTPNGGTTNVLDSLLGGSSPCADIDAFMPDGYKISVTFQSLVSNSFNVYLNYLLNGAKKDVTIGKEVKRKSPVSQMTDVTKQVGSMVAGTAASTINEASKYATSLIPG